MNSEFHKYKELTYVNIHVTLHDFFWIARYCLRISSSLFNYVEILFCTWKHGMSHCVCYIYVLLALPIIPVFGTSNYVYYPCVLHFFWLNSFWKRNKKRWWDNYIRKEIKNVLFQTSKLKLLYKYFEQYTIKWIERSVWLHFQQLYAIFKAIYYI